MDVKNKASWMVVANPPILLGTGRRTMADAVNG
jgi:hypothetical protein